MKNKNINNILNMTDDLEEKIAEEIEIVPEDCTFDEKNPEKDIAEDYKFIRNKLRYSIAACEAVFAHALRDLAANPTPRVVEGCSTILKTITECTSQLFDVHGKYQKMIPVKDNDVSTDDGKGIKTSVNEIISAFSQEEEE